MTENVKAAALGKAATDELNGDSSSSSTDDTSTHELIHLPLASIDPEDTDAEEDEQDEAPELRSGIAMGADFFSFGDVIDAIQRATAWSDTDLFSKLETVMEEGIYFDSEGEEITGPRRDRVRDRLHGEQPRPLAVSGIGGNPFLDEDGSAAETTWLIPGMQAWGTGVFLGGAPKSGKTELVADLVAALLVPGTRFLNYFEPADLPEDGVLDRGILVVNAETNSRVFRQLLWRAGVDDTARPGAQFRPRDLVNVVDLAEGPGGPASFDVTDPAVFDRWSRDLVYDESGDLDGSGEWAPFAVIVDGLTAILGGETSRYGVWYSKFRELMALVGVENSFVTGHSTLRGDHLMGGVEALAGSDGNWVYTLADADNPWSSRVFRTSPRTGNGDPFSARVKRTDGRLLIDPSTVRWASPERPVNASEGPSGTNPPAGTHEAPQGHPQTGGVIREKVLDFVSRCNGAGTGPSVRQIRDEIPGDNSEVDSALRALVDDGRLTQKTRKGRGGGHAYWATPSLDDHHEGADDEA